MINVEEKDLMVIKMILARHVPDSEVRVFGSRVNDQQKSYSDMDLVIVGKDKLAQDKLIQLKDAFVESSLPFRVDVLDWHRTSLKFRRIIDEKFEIIQWVKENKSN